MNSLRKPVTGTTECYNLHSRTTTKLSRRALFSYLKLLRACSFQDLRFCRRFSSVDLRLPTSLGWKFQWLLRSKDIEWYFLGRAKENLWTLSTPAANEPIRCTHLFLGSRNTCCTMPQNIIIKHYHRTFKQILSTWSSANSSSKSLR